MDLGLDFSSAILFMQPLIRLALRYSLSTHYVFWMLGMCQRHKHEALALPGEQTQVVMRAVERSKAGKMTQRERGTLFFDQVVMEMTLKQKSRESEGLGCTKILGKSIPGRGNSRDVLADVRDRLVAALQPPSRGQRQGSQEPPSPHVGALPECPQAWWRPRAAWVG